MAPLDTPSYLTVDAKREISAALTTLLADMFALYVKTKNSTGTSPGRTSAITT
jgi:starvation-inducible DNA-binding protein